METKDTYIVFCIYEKQNDYEITYLSKEEHWQVKKRFYQNIEWAKEYSSYDDALNDLHKPLEEENSFQYNKNIDNLLGKYIFFDLHPRCRYDVVVKENI